MVVDLYNNIFVAVSSDTDILGLLNLDDESTMLQKALKIQKREKPQNLTDNIPIICFFTPGGKKDSRNDQVYNSTFIFDIYTKDDVNKAHKIASRLRKIFSDDIPKFSNLTTFRIMWEDSFESKTDLQNTYCFTSVFTFPIALCD